MSRITKYRTGYFDNPTPPVVPPPSAGQVHNGVDNGYYCDPWEAPVYETMDGEGTECNPSSIPVVELNRYLNFPRRLEGETASAPNYEDIGSDDVKDDLRDVYIPAGIAPDPVYGNYINLFKIFDDNDACNEDTFTHTCFPTVDVCSPPQYVPGYLDVPIPFISFQPTDPGSGSGSSDPGMSGITAVKSIYMTLDTSFLCLTVTSSTWSRDPGVREVTEGSGPVEVPCVDVTECPPEA